MKHTESEAQVDVFRRASYKRFRDGTVRDYIYAVVNTLPRSGKRAMLQMLQLKREGLTKGIPDIECMVAAAPFTGLHIELKKPDGVPSDVTAEQKDVMARMTKCGRKCVVAYGADEAWNALMLYLKL